MKTRIKHPTLHSVLVFVAFSMIYVPASGQNDGLILSERIAVTARPSADSITLRWAPLNLHTWRWGNSQGYRIERYTLARNGRLLSPLEKRVLSSSHKPEDERAWETLVQHNKYAAIAAQAMFGDRFEVDLKQSDIFSIVNKVQENEQRFAFSLFCADMSPDVARASGLWFSDKAVTQGEKYLYRVVINTMDSLRGSVFISPDDPYILPQPQNLKGDFKEHMVSLRWDKNNIRLFTAYLVERSDDGKRFRSISDAPIVTVSPTAAEDTRYEYAIDSLKDLSRTYYYRVKGLTAFGEESPPSASVSGKGLPPVNQVPYISSAENIRNTSVLIGWYFPESDQDAITGFSIERSSRPGDAFSSLTENLLPPRARNFEDTSPQQVNYYRVTAHGLDNSLYRSHVFLAQLVDSIPPAAPTGLQGKITNDGKVTVSWKPNSEPDIFGYRIYKAYHLSEELSQITDAPVAQSTFTDQLDLNTLNETAYYCVMALDINQNHSRLSELLKVSLPDKVRPQPPVFLPVKSTRDGVSLGWVRGSSEDIVQYNVYRKAPGKSEWMLIKNEQARADSVYHHVDETAYPGQVNYYTIVAVDDAGLESAPANPVAGGIVDQHLRPEISWKKPRVNREQGKITISWEYGQLRIESFKIFRAVDQHPLVLFQTVNGRQKQITHDIIPGQHYRYRIMALFTDGKKSFLSEEMEFRY